MDARCGPFCLTCGCDGRLRRENGSGSLRGFEKLFRYCLACWLACGDLTAGPGLLWDCGKHLWCVSEHPPVSRPADLPKSKFVARISGPAPGCLVTLTAFTQVKGL